MVNEPIVFEPPKFYCTEFLHDTNFYSRCFTADIRKIVCFCSSSFIVYPLGDNRIRIGNRTRLYAVSVLDCTPFSFVGTTIFRSHYFSVLLCFVARLPEFPSALLTRHDHYSLS